MAARLGFPADEILRKVAVARVPRQKVGHDETPPHEDDAKTQDVLAERDLERRPVPRRPTADPSLRAVAEPENAALGRYVPPHLLF